MSEIIVEGQVVGFKDRTKETVPFAGSVVTLQNMAVIMPPLNFAALRTSQGLKKMNAIKAALEAVKTNNGFESITEEVLEDVIDLTYKAVHRNYPDVSKDEIAEGLTVDALAEVMGSLLTINPGAQIKNV